MCCCSLTGKEQEAKELSQYQAVHQPAMDNEKPMAILDVFLPSGISRVHDSWNCTPLPRPHQASNTFLRAQRTHLVMLTPTQNIGEVGSSFNVSQLSMV
jgi:hypothetical protein